MGEKVTPDELQQALTEGAVLCRDPASRFVYVGEQGHAQRLYVNGEEICIDEGVDGQFVAYSQITPNSPPPINHLFKPYLNSNGYVSKLKGLFFGFS
jgi:hypothetical protein